MGGHPPLAPAQVYTIARRMRAVQQAMGYTGWYRERHGSSASGDPCRNRCLRPPPARYGATHGSPEQTSTTAPPLTFKKSDFCCRASGEFRGSECGSGPTDGAVFVVGAGAAPLPQTIRAEPSNGSVGMAGMLK